MFYYRQLNEMGGNAVCGCSVLFSDSEVVNMFIVFTVSSHHHYHMIFSEVSVFFSVDLCICNFSCDHDKYTGQKVTVGKKGLFGFREQSTSQ